MERFQCVFIVPIKQKTTRLMYTEWGVSFRHRTLFRGRFKRERHRRHSTKIIVATTCRTKHNWAIVIGDLNRMTSEIVRRQRRNWKRLCHACLQRINFPFKQTIRNSTRKEVRADQRALLRAFTTHVNAKAAETAIVTLANEITRLPWRQRCNRIALVGE